MLDAITERIVLTAQPTRSVPADIFIVMVVVAQVVIVLMQRKLGRQIMS